MTWLFWLAAVAILAGFAAVTGVKPKVSRPVSNTRLMGVARFFLFVIVVLFTYFAFRAYAPAP